MMSLQTKLFGILILSLAFIGIYTAGVSEGRSAERLKAEQAYNVKLMQYNQTLQAVTESNNQQKFKISTLEGELKHETAKNAKLLNDNNRISKQFTKLYDSSTRLSIAASNESDATSASSIAPDRILQVMQQNNLNHQRCISDLTAWQEWYRQNS
ncbi:MAG: hypothetical protein EKK54_11585 [Neisseriaceae bacterium]|nr:MAG: hypothetical protein EKK54_11585 [Neisseriaceae bacterium]